MSITRTVSALIAAIFLPSVLSAQALDMDAMAQVRETADSICGEFMRGGSNREIEIAGEVNAELRGLAKRLVDAGIQGGARLEDGSYANVLREELGPELQNIRDCRLKIFEKLLDRIDISLRDGKKPLPEPNEYDPEYTELAGRVVVLGHYINCEVFNSEPQIAQVTSINYMLQGMYGSQPVSYPCIYNCGIMAYRYHTFTGPQNTGVMNATCTVTALR